MPAKTEAGDESPQEEQLRLALAGLKGSYGMLEAAGEFHYLISKAIEAIEAILAGEA